MNVFDAIRNNEAFMNQLGADAENIRIEFAGRYGSNGIWECKTDVDGNFSVTMHDTSIANTYTLSNYQTVGGFIYDSDGDKTYFQMLLDFNKFEEKPEIIIGSDENDIIDPNVTAGIYSGNNSLRQEVAVIIAGSKVNEIYGGLGDDVIFGEGSYYDPKKYGTIEEWHDAIKNGQLLSNFNVSFGPSSDLVFGGQGNDSICVSGINSVIFGDGDDAEGGNSFGILSDMTGFTGNWQDFYQHLANNFVPKQLEQFVERLEITDGFEKVTDSNDVIWTLYPSGVICSGGGNDYIATQGQKSIVFSGSGDDIINNTGNNSSIFTGSGNDWIGTALFYDYISCGKGNDIISIVEASASFNGSPIYSFYIDGGEGIDMLISSPGYYSTGTQGSLSNLLKSGKIENVEVMLWDSNRGNVLKINDETDIEQRHAYVYGEGDRAIILNEEENTISLGAGWHKVLGSETGKHFYRTQTYEYIDENGQSLKLETTLNVAPIEPVEPGTILSGHDSAIPGRLSFDFGADNGTGKKLSVMVDGKEYERDPNEHNFIEGLYGTLTIENNGLFSYKANANAEGVDDFYFRIQDADGDIVDTDFSGEPLKLSVNVVKPEAPVEPEVTLDEAQLTGDNSLEEAFGLAGYTILDARVNGDAGQLVQDADGSWKYVLSDNLDHSNMPIIDDVINMTVQDRFGNTWDIEKNIHIMDSAPSFGIINVHTTNVETTTGTSDPNQTGAQLFYRYGADDDLGKTAFTVKDAEGKEITSTEGKQTTVRGQYGSLTFIVKDGNIDYSYTADQIADSEDIFKFTVTDSDGSQARDYLKIKDRNIIEQASWIIEK